MSEQNSTEENVAPAGGGGKNGLGDSRLVKTLTYGTVAIGATWGLVEILLVTDPFLATFFKYAWIIGAIALTLALAIPALFARLGPLQWTVALLALVTGVLALASALGGRLVSLPVPSFEGGGLPIGLAWVLGVYGVCAILYAVASFAPSGLTERLRTDITPPMLFAAAIMGIFAFAISQGRAREIERRDVALEELRAAGMLYTLESLQNSLFFLNARGARLYHDADIRYDDMLYALGQPSNFSGDDPLLFSILDRAEEDEERVERFIETMSEAQGLAGPSSLKGDFATPFEVSVREDDAAAPRGDGRRPLLSFIIERRAEHIAAALLRAGARPLYDADIGAPPTAAAASPAEANADLTLSAADAHEVHVRAVLDPVYAFSELGPAPADASGRMGSARSQRASEREHTLNMCALAETMLQRHGVHPLSFVRSRLAQAFGELGPLSEAEAARPGAAYCQDIPAGDVEASEQAVASNPPALVQPFEQVHIADGEAHYGREGYAVRQLPGGTCEVSDATFASTGNRIETIAPALESAGPGWMRSLSFLGGSASAANDPEMLGVGERLWFIGVEGHIGGAEAIGALQARRTAEGDLSGRAIFGTAVGGPADGLNYTDWEPIDADESPVFIAGGPGGLLAIPVSDDVDDARIDLEPARAIIRDASGASQGERESEPDDPIRLALYDVENGQKDAALVASVSRMQPRAEADFRSPDEASRIGFGVERHTGSLCLQLIAKTAGGERVVASRFAPARVATELVADYVPPSTDLVTRVTLADVANVERAVFAVRAEPGQPPNLQCGSFEVAQQPNLRAVAVQDARTDELLFSDAPEAYCRIEVDQRTNLQLALRGMAIDIDLDLLTGDGADSLQVLESSTAGGSDDELISTLLEPGVYYAHAYAFDTVPEEGTPYSLIIERADVFDDSFDRYRPTADGEPFALGALSLATPEPVSIYDLALSVPEVFEFELEEASLVNVLLSEMTDDLDLAVYEMATDRSQSSARGGMSDDDLSLPLQAGVYRVEVDPSFASAPSPYRLTITADPLPFAADADAYAPNAGGAPHPLGAVGDEPVVVSDMIDGALGPGSDVFRVEASERALLEINLSGAYADLDVYVTNEAGEQIAVSTGFEPGEDQAIAFVEPGVYDVEVAPVGLGMSPYTLQLQAQPADDTYAPNTDGPPYELGAVAPGGDAITIEDLAAAGSDVFRVELTEEALLQARISGLSSDVDLFLRDGTTGDEIDSSVRGGDSDDDVAVMLPAGVYDIEVMPLDTNVSRYTLTVQAVVQTVVDLGELTADGGSVVEEGGLSPESSTAFHQVSLASEGILIVTLQGMDVDVDVFIFDENGDQVGSGVAGGNDDEYVEISVPAGAYRVEVELYDAQPTPYRLELTLTQ